jgi:hypothetical protein
LPLAGSFVLAIIKKSGIVLNIAAHLGSEVIPEITAIKNVIANINNPI